EGVRRAGGRDVLRQPGRHRRPGGAAEAQLVQGVRDGQVRARVRSGPGAGRGRPDAVPAVRPGTPAHRTGEVRMGVGKNDTDSDLTVDQSAGVYGAVGWSTPPSSSGAVGSPDRFLDGPSWRQGPLEASAGDHATAAAGTDASLTLAAPDGRHVIYG